MESTVDAERERRLELARRAFKEFYSECFWSSPLDFEVGESDIDWIIRGLRHHGGHKGYRMVAELCH